MIPTEVPTIGCVSDRGKAEDLAATEGIDLENFATKCGTKAPRPRPLMCHGIDLDILRSILPENPLFTRYLVTVKGISTDHGLILVKNEKRLKFSLHVFDHMLSQDLENEVLPSG
jgi:hypothetical protein